MSRKLIHRSPLGPLVIPGVLGAPEPGEPFEVDDDIAESLLTQGELYFPAEETDLTVSQLRDLAAERGVDLRGARTKAEIADAIARHEEPATVGDSSPDDTEPAATDAAGETDSQEGGDQ